MGLTKAQARSKLRGLLRDEDADNFSTPYIDARLEASLRSLVGNELAAVASDFFFTRRVLTGLTDALDKGTVGTQKVNELYPLPEDLKKLRFIYRADLAGEPILWGQRSEEQAAHRFGGVLQGTITLDGSTYGTPQFHSGQAVSIEGNKFRVVPGPSSTTELFGVAFERQSLLPTGENDVMDFQDELQEAWLQFTAYEVLMLEGDPQAENLRLLAWGDPRNGPADTGSIGRAKKAARERTVGNLSMGRVRFG